MIHLFVLPRALRFLLTTFPRLFFIRCALVRPPEVFTLPPVPRKTVSLASLFFAILETRIALRRRMLFMAFFIDFLIDFFFHASLLGLHRTTLHRHLESFFGPITVTKS